MSAVLTILPVQLEDAPALEALEADAFGDASWGEGGVSGSLFMAGVEGVKAVLGTPASQKEEAQGRLVGFGLSRLVVGAGVGGLAAACGQYGEGDILTIAVAPDHRRQGVARALLLRMMDDARMQNVGSLTLEVSAENLAARGLYEGQGFEEIGMRKKYYRNGADAIVMQCPLTSMPVVSKVD